MDANSAEWKDVKIKYGIKTGKDENGKPKRRETDAGAASEEEKNRVIELAVSTWTEMGLTDEEISTGIAVMNVESGFNYKARIYDPNNSNLTAEGLGQFIDDTWKWAVAEYKKNPNGHLDHELSRQDRASQIAVMGTYIRWVSTNTKKVQMPGYDKLLVFYALWHEGCSAGSEKWQLYLDNKKPKDNFTDETRDFLLNTHKAVKDKVPQRVRQIKDAKQKSSLRYQINEHNKRIAPYAADEEPDNVGKHSEAKSGFLVRYGNIVRRFNSDGSDGGSFVS